MFKDKFEKLKGSRLLSHLLPILVVVVLSIFFNIMTKGRFLSQQSIKTIINQALTIGVISTGAVFIFATNNVNIALGGTTAISAIVGAAMWNATKSVSIFMLSCILCAVVILYFSCILSTLFKVKVVSVTMVMMGLLTALQQWIMLKYVTIGVDYLVILKLNKANSAVILFVITFIVLAYLFCFTKLGRKLKLIGDNQNCAIQTGVNVDRTITVAFIIAGIAAGVGAILLLLRSSSVSSSTAGGLNMDVMLAIVLGGMPVTGGYKSKIEAGALGALTVTILNTGLLMINVNPTIIQAVKGVCFVILIVLSNKRPDLLPIKEMS